MAKQSTIGKRVTKEGKEVLICDDTRFRLLPVLQAIQEKKGYISDKDMQTIADKFNIHPVEVYSVITFYSLVDDVGLGVLFGLYDWRFEVMALVAHSREMEKTFGIGPHTISFPRLEPAVNTPFTITPEYRVSDYCRKDCKYCGLRKSNNRILRYRMSEEEIFLSAQKACSLGYKTVVLQSGEDEYYRTVMLCRLIERIKGEFDCAVTLSIGERDYSDYRQLREAGADRYLLKFETSDETLFAGLKSDSCYQRRLQSINQLKQLGYQIGSGNIVGLPGQTLSSLADNLLLIEELDLDMAGIGPFIPHPNTPLASAAGGNLLDSLKILALTRIIMGDVHLPATTALGSIDSQGRQKALQCGANVIMPDITPEEYRPHYEIYPGRICIEDNPDECAGYIKSMVSLLGRKIAEDKGDSLRKPGVNSWNTGN